MSENNNVKMKLSKYCDKILDSIKIGMILIDENKIIKNIDKECLEWCVLKADKKENIVGSSLEYLIQKGVFIDVYQLLHSEYNKKNRKFIVKIRKINKTYSIIIVYNLDQICRFSSIDSAALSTPKNENKIIAFSKKMTSVVNFALKIAKIDSTILITGESGVGKDLLARFIHFSSNRKNFPFVEINCPSVPDNLFETELFGYEGGAFSGANLKGKKGLFEIADKGTVFLNEIAELPLHMQAKLLSVLQEKKITKVGGVKPIDIDVRIIAATNKNLNDLVQQKKIREDLYYRLDVISIYIHPLRERLEDLEPLVFYILDNLNAKYHMSKTISSDLIAYFKTLPWKGNVRELENFIEKLILTIESQHISKKNIELFNLGSNNESGVNLKFIRSNSEKEMLIKALSACRTTRQMANYLGISQSSVVRKLKKYNLQRE